MDKETQKYYERYFDLFSNEGWSQLIEEMEDTFATINNVTTIQDEKDMYYRKGQLDAMLNIIRFKNTIEETYEDLVAND